MAKFWQFRQNNSGGSFNIDDDRGLGPRVWVEADSLSHAIDRAQGIGIYFDGCASGLDCNCCGDRWYEPWDSEGADVCELDPHYDFSWWNTVYLHRLDGAIERITAEETGRLQPHIRIAA